jgi:3-methyladenine DNA glycosylase AlkC
MSLLKDLYSSAFYKRIARCMEECIPSFNANAFMKRIYSPEFETMELKARMRHTAQCLHYFMPGTYGEAADLLIKLIESLKEHGFWQERLEMMFLPTYIELYGLDDPDTSIQAMEVVTQYVSCEFAIRPFLNNHFGQTIATMLVWTEHPNARVRRLATEGCRPRLPWGLAVSRLKKDPAPILPILEALKNDPDEAVRRSVANNLNDISKDHPDVVVEIAKAWKGKSKETDAVIKHGCRTLLKHGHEVVLNHYGLNASNIQFDGFQILTPKVNIGAALQFNFRICNLDAGSKTIRLEYAIHYRKANDQLSRKVFKISERVYQQGQCEFISRNQSFRLITTRKFYEGDHALEIMINGSVMVKGNFTVSH